MKAKTREQYTQAWTSHVNELIHLFLDADRPINDWEEAKANLLAVIEDASFSVFPVESLTDEA